MRFYTGSMFPADYRNAIFIAEHGSWNRSTKFGYRVVRVSTGPDGGKPRMEVFAQGWLQPDEHGLGTPGRRAAAARRLAAHQRRLRRRDLPDHLYRALSAAG